MRLPIGMVLVLILTLLAGACQQMPLGPGPTADHVPKNDSGGGGSSSGGGGSGY